jgi:uncharacterized protein YbjT (DUF2867 family)
MIVVTGATGTIGTDVVKLLAQRGQEVRAVVRNVSKASALRGPGVDIVPGDLSDPASLDRAFHGADRLFLLTGGSPDMVGLERNAIDAARRAVVKHIVYLSSAGAELDSKLALAQWHATTEAELRDSGIFWTILRPTYFMQNTFSFAPTIKAQGAFYGASKDGQLGMIDTRDIAEVAATALTDMGHAGKTYELTGPEAISMGEVASKIAGNIGRPVKYVDLPADQLKQGMLKAGLPEWLAGDLSAMSAYFATGGAARVSPTYKEITGKRGRTYDDFLHDLGGAFKP